MTRGHTPARHGLPMPIRHNEASIIAYLEALFEMNDRHRAENAALRAARWAARRAAHSAEAARIKRVRQQVMNSADDTL